MLGGQTRSINATENEAVISARRIVAREKRRDRLLATEDAETFEAHQHFLRAVSRLASSRRLSRIVYLGRKM